MIASGTFGFSASEVVVFAIAANLVAGVATLLGGGRTTGSGRRR